MTAVSSRAIARRLRLPPLLRESPVLRQLAWTSFLSTLGSAFQGIAFGYLAYARWSTAIAPVLVISGFTVGYAAISLPAGRWAQRLDRRRLGIASNLAKVLLYAVVLALSIGGTLSFIALVAASAIAGLTSAVSYPPWQGILHALARDQRLDQANALFASLSSVAKIVGALLGGTVLAALGPDPLFGFNILSYLPYSWALARVPASAARAKGAPPAATPLPQVTRIVRARVLLGRTVLITVVLELLAFPLLSVLPRLAADVGSSARYYGILAGGFYAGAAVVVLLLRTLKRRGIAYARIIRVTTVAAGAAIVVYAVAGATIDRTAVLLAVLLVSIVCVGAALTTASAVLTAITQLEAPADIEGRILGFYALATLTTTTVGGLVIGALGDITSIWWVLAVAGGLVTAFGLALRRMRAFAVFDRIEYRPGDHGAFHHAHDVRTAVAAATMPTTARPGVASRLGDGGERS